MSLLVKLVKSIRSVVHGPSVNITNYILKVQTIYQILRSPVSYSHHESSLHLTDVNFGIQAYTIFNHQIDPSDNVLTGQYIDLYYGSSDTVNIFRWLIYYPAKVYI
ncbi:hypothetical protein ALC57_05641 [Trachymyrmex cornetzi]|uniref:Uncharacterized protein n=1 Tax=Trachymyrmex cornetzi TaxID=471704 RepID=A0A151JA75_9HYME|nr:hypothetical protein ALC57_05641 [Trachymyrmex cornetzi]